MIERSALARWLPALLPIAGMLVLIQRLAVNVPYQDDWDMLTVVTHWRAGTATLDDFWQQHSEHRVVALKAVVWAIGALTDFNVVFLMLAGFVVAVLTFALMADLLRGALQGRMALLVTPAVTTASFLMFSLVQHENWFFATASLQLLLLNLCTVTLVWTLTRWPLPWTSLALAIACATIGMFVEVSGQLLWFTGAAAIALAVPAPRERLHRTVVWTLAGSVTLVAYFRGLHWASGSLGAALANPIPVLMFAGNCLGLPLGAWAGPQWSVFVGCGGCVILATACWSLQRREPALLQRLVPLLLLAFNAVLTTLLIAIGRAGGDPRSALTSHYAFAPTLFWIAVITVTAVQTVVAWPERSRAARVRGLAASALLCALLVVAYVRVNIDGYREAYVRSRNLRMASAALVSPEGASREVLRFLYPPDEEQIQRLVVELRTFRLGPFSTSIPDGSTTFAARLASVATAGELADGYLDGGDCSGTTGWAWDPAHPDAPVMLDIWNGGTWLGRVRADWFRWDLRAAGKGNGQHAFRFLFPTQTELRTGQLVTVTFADTQRPIRGSPKIIPCRD